MRRTALVLLGLLPLLAGQAGADSASGQIWANFTLDYPKDDRLLYEIDLEPKGQYSGTETWRGIDVTPLVEYSVNRWFDLAGETAFARTKQSNSVSSTEVTPRVGVRLHLVSNVRTMLPGRRPLGRVGISNLSRFEWRNLWYSDDTPSSHETRFRNRLELKVGLNHKELSLDKTLFLVADFELFVPLSDDVPERFATKRRARVGLGYRRDSKWRFELLYIRDGTRTTDQGSFATAANIVDFRVKVLF